MSYIDYKQFTRGQAPQNFSYALNMLLERLMADETITQSEMTVCLALAKCCHQGDGQCFPKVKTAMITAKVSERTFRTCLKTLEAKGYIDRKARHRQDGAQSSNIYILPMMILATRPQANTTNQPPQYDRQNRSAQHEAGRGEKQITTQKEATPTHQEVVVSSASVAGTPCNDCTPIKKDPLKKEISLSSHEIFSKQAKSKQEEKDELSYIQRNEGEVARQPDSPQRLHKAFERKPSLSGQAGVELPSQDQVTEKRYLVDLSLLGIGITASGRGDADGLYRQAPQAPDRHRELCDAHG